MKTTHNVFKLININKFINNKNTKNNLLESTIKRYYKGKFIIHKENEYNILITDQYCNINSMNYQLDKHNKITQLIIVNNINNLNI